MNFYDVLAAKNWSGGIPTINFFDLLFAQSISAEQWETYEGTLPATINANGDDMRQYRLYGNTGGVGTWDDTEQSYKLDMNVKSGNLFDKNALVNGYAIYQDGSITEAVNYAYSDLMSATQGVYVLTGLITSTSSLRWTLRVHGYVNGAWQTQILMRNIKSTTPQSITFDVPSGVNGIRLCIGINNRQNIDILSVSRGNTAPASYQPYYNATTPIYIGDDPLDKDEYVDYAEQKVYRMIDGTLTPTDPPVALPALPTREGTTIVDYAGSGTAPEKVYFEYKQKR